MRTALTSRLTAALAALALLGGACASAAAPDATPDDPSPSVAETSSPDAESPSPSSTPAEPSPEPVAALGPDSAPPIVRGIYVTPYSFYGERWARLMDLVKTTEINAMVIDVKDESGTLLWDMDLELAREGGGADWLPEGADPRERLAELVAAGGYPIARVACFKDTGVALARPDLAVQTSNGAVWKARKNFSWLNPYADEADQWCIDVGLAAIEMGFREVQYDYIRFPNGGDGNTADIALPGVPDDRPRDQWRHPEQITEFLAKASEQIHDAGGLVSADLFGLVTYDFSWDAQGTGQILEEIAEHVDFISPMVYPSHYGNGNYGLKPHPVDHPYELVWNAMQEAQMRTQGLRAQIRPWLEDFAPTWMGRSHSPQRVLDQKRGTYENGIEGWLLWNAGNSYSVEALAKGEAVSEADPDFVAPYRTADPDAPPGATSERKWPGRPDCVPDRAKLFIGIGNLAASTPPVRAPGVGEDIKCVEPEPEAEPSPDATASPTGTESPTG